MSELVGERGVGRAEVRVGRMVRKREKREKREMEVEVVVVGEEGSIFCVGGSGDGGRGEGIFVGDMVLLLLLLLG